MKSLKKMMALTIAMVMVLAMGVTAMAEELPEGTASNAKTITITSPTELAATDTTTYHIYKVFNATSNGTSAGINYTLLDGKNALVATDELSKFDKDAVGNIHYYERDDTSTDWIENTTRTQLSAHMIEAIGTYISGDAEVGSVTITGANQSKTVTVPDYGYYYITTTTGTVVTIDSTNPFAKVSDKNSVPSVDKTITGISNDGTVDQGKESGNGKVGDVVTYQVVVHAKKGAVNYIFHDKLSPGLSLEAQSNLSIKVDDTDVDATNYTVQYWSDTDATAVTQGNGDCEVGDNITVRFENDYLATITKDTDIVISYKAKINDNAVIASTGNPNTVDLEYGHDPTETDENKKKEPTKKTEEDSATVYTYALALKKVNQQGENLADATFKFPFYVKKTAAADGSYIYAFATLPATFAEGDSAANYTNTLATPANGEITIKGVQNVEYLIEETVAPNGYNKLNEPFSITPEKTSATTTTTSKTTYLDADGKIVDEEVTDGGHTVTYTLHKHEFCCWRLPDSS